MTQETPKSIPITDRDKHTTYFEIIDTPHSFFENLARDITNANKTLRMSFFTFEFDQQTQPIFQALETAAKKGVKIQIVVDHVGISPNVNYRTRKAISRLKAAGNVEIHTSTAKDNEIRGPLKGQLLRMHKKIVAIDSDSDNAIGYIGGINISGRHSNYGDMAVRLTQKEAVAFLDQDVQETFSDNNNLYKEQRIDEYTSLFSVGRANEGLVNNLIDEINEAKSTIYMETGYVDKGPIRDALITASNRGVDIHIIVPQPGSTNDLFYSLNPGAYLDPFLSAKIPLSIYVYKPGAHVFNHTKLLLIDNKALTGSFNFITGNLSGNNEEVLLQSTDPIFFENCKSRFDNDLRDSKPWKS